MGFVQLVVAALIAWAVGMAGLIGLGVALSRATLWAATGPEGNAGPTLRAVYRAVIGVTCVAYYLSLPLVMVATLGLTFGVIGFFFTVGRIPIKLVALLLFFGAASAWSVVRAAWALLWPRRAEDPGARLDLDANPGLRATLDDVAATIGTRPVDAVFLTPGTEFAVFERGGMWRRLFGTPERCMILGVANLDGFRLAPFKSVLAHEYGHFSNRDTAGGGFALGVRRSVVTMAESLASAGVATSWNPAWLFVRAFHSTFLRVSQGASRLQEILADRAAAVAYGGPAFEEGFRHVIRRGVTFNAQANGLIGSLRGTNTRVTNLYAQSTAVPIADDQVERAVEEIIEREPSPFDSHPRPADRIAWAHRISASPAPADERTAWDLFTDRVATELAMTDVIREDVFAGHGILI